MNKYRENILINIFETNSIAIIPVLPLLITALHNIYNNTDIINIQELIDFDLQHLMLKSKINISNKTIDIITNDIPSSLSISQCNAGRLLSNREIRQTEKKMIYLITITVKKNKLS